MIILLGLSAIKSFYPDAEYMLPYVYKFGNIRKTIIACAYHPSYILRNKDKEKAYAEFFNNVSILYSKLNPCYFNPYLNG
jgi:uracil-DNA glycosylase